jgi:hypothetical protein
MKVLVCVALAFSAVLALTMKEIYIFQSLQLASWGVGIVLFAPRRSFLISVEQHGQLT